MTTINNGNDGLQPPANIMTNNGNDGLQWISKNAEKENMRSLALLALGCGLGGLPWGKIEPKMCQYLSKLNIPCEIYLPREVKIPSAQLSKEFLLG